MKLFFRKRPARRVLLYGKPGCHLCDEALKLLDGFRSTYTLTVEVIDITTDPALFRAYDIRIPVLVINGRSQLEAPIRYGNLKRALKDS